MPNPARSAIVTGGAGFIGSHLADGLLEAGVEPVVVFDDLSLGSLDNVPNDVEFHQRDCCDVDRLREALLRRSFDLCFNLAVIPLPASLVDPRSNVNRNVAMTTAVCELGREGRFGRLVQYSSSEVYGTARVAPMPETHPLAPHTPYAAAKAATDLVAASYATTFGLEVVTVRPFNTYGERQNAGAYAGIIPAVLNRVRAGLPVEIYGDGEQTRDMTYVRDTVAGSLAAAAADEAASMTLNIGSGSEASVNEIVGYLLEAVGRPDHPVEHVAPRLGDVRRLLADVSLARETIGYEPQVALRDGLARTVAWYQR